MKSISKKLISILTAFLLIFSLTTKNVNFSAKAATSSIDKMKASLVQRLEKQNFSETTKNNLEKKLGDKALQNDGDGTKNSKTFDPNEKVRVIVELENSAVAQKSEGSLSPTTSSNLSKINTAINSVKSSQSTIVSKVEKLTGSKVRRSYGYLINGFSITAKRSDIPKIAAIDGVKNVAEAQVYYPDMTFAKNLTQAYSVWQDYGYKGEGMVISIIDTGIDYNHKDMVVTDPSKDKLQSTSPNGPGKFYTAKVPYGYNFADASNDIIPRVSPHGMHVAGIVAANGKDSAINSYNAVKGVAPEAQLLAMKVFSNTPGTSGAYDDDIVAAIEDSVLHGADVINMSLGSSAGFTDATNVTQTVIRNAVNQGVVVAISAGNSAISTTDSGWNVPPTNLLGTTDTSTVGTPGTTSEALTVASYENTNIVHPYFTYTSSDGSGQPIAYTTSEVDPASVLKDINGYEVVDCGQGKNGYESAGNDFDPAKLSGKIALVQKVTGSFYNKKKAAQAAGAIGVIFYNAKDDEKLYSTSPQPDISIPCINVSYTSGKTLLDLLAKDLKVSFKGNLMNIPNPDASDMSPFTSWGPTPSLDFKPEISAPGGNIYSTVPDNKYDTMSGTSMASPHIAGSEALILQAIKAKNLGLTGKALVDFAKNTTINTAKVEMDKYHSDVPYSPRRQGAGLIQIEDAIKNNVIVTDKNGNAAFALKEIGSTTTFTLNLKNYGSTDAVYNLKDLGVLSEGSDPDSGAVFDYTISNAKLSFDNDIVTVKANSDASVNVTLTLPNTFDKQQFAEGYIKLESTDSKVPSLVVPYMGFYGDWSELQTIDKPMWDKDSLIGATSLGYKLFGALYIPYGMNFSDGSVNPDNAAFSPINSMFNTATPNLYFLRNAKTLKAEVLDKDKNVINTISMEGNISKNILEDELPNPNWGKFDSQSAWYGGLYNQGTGTLDLAPEGQYYIRITTKSDTPSAKEQVLDMPIKLDVTAPEVKITSSNSSESENYTLTFTAKDSLSGLNNNTMIYVNGNEISSDEYNTLTSDGDNFSCNIKLDPNIENLVEVVSTDYAFNMGYDSMFVKANNTAPVTLFNIYDGMNTNSNKYSIAGYVRDDVKSLSINNKAVTILDDRTFEETINFVEGENTVNITSKDSEGNELSNDNLKVYCDSIAPVIKLTEPDLSKESIVYTDKDTLKISGTINEKNPYTLSLLVNNEFKDNITPSQDNSFTAETPISGNTLVSLIAIDDCGNQSELDITVVSSANTDPFNVQFDNFTSFTILNKDNLSNGIYTITGLVNHPTKVFKIGGKDVTINKDLTFAVDVPIVQGNNNVGIYAEDEKGNVLYNYAYKVLYDSEAPQLSISEPTLKKDGKFYSNNDTLTIKGNVSDNTYGYSFFINGNAVLTADKYPQVGNANNKLDFSYNVSLANGKNILDFALVDEFGNYTETQYEAVLDKVAPKQATLTEDTTSTTNKDVNVTIASDKSDTDVEKIEYSFDNKVWLNYSEPVKVVLNTKLYARLTDFAGNTTVSELDITNIDKTAPVVSLTGIDDGTLTNKDVKVAATTNEGTLKITLDGKDYDGSVISAEGKHTVVTTAVDSASNSSSKQVTFTIDKTAPVITVSGVEDNKEYPNKVSPKVSVNEGTYTVTLDGKPYDGNDVVASGIHALIITAKDDAQNVSAKALNFTIKSTVSTVFDAQTIANSINNSPNTNVQVAFDSTTSTAPHDLFKEIAGKNKTVTFTVGTDNPITWTFDASKIDPNKAHDIDLSLNVVSPNAQAISSLEANSQIVSFKYHGELPAPAIIRLKVDTSKIDTSKGVYLYYYNEDTKKVELIAGPLTPDKDGYVEFTITHCSDYFFSNSSALVLKQANIAAPKTGSPIDGGMVTGFGIALIVLGAAVMYVYKRKRS